MAKIDPPSPLSAFVRIRPSPPPVRMSADCWWCLYRGLMSHRACVQVEVRISHRCHQCQLPGVIQGRQRDWTDSHRAGRRIPAVILWAIYWMQSLQASVVTPLALKSPLPPCPLFSPHFGLPPSGADVLYGWPQRNFWGLLDELLYCRAPKELIGNWVYSQKFKKLHG